MLNAVFGNVVSESAMYSAEVSIYIIMKTYMELLYI